MAEHDGERDVSEKDELLMRTLGGFRLRWTRGAYRVDVPRLEPPPGGLPVVPFARYMGEREAADWKIRNNTREWEREKARAGAAEAELREALDVLGVYFGDDARLMSDAVGKPEAQAFLRKHGRLS